MKTLFRTIAVATLFFLNGCADFYANNRYYGGTSDSYERIDIDELLKFAGDFASQSAGFRVEECRQLLKREKRNPTAGVQLHLLMGRMLSEACGDIPKVLKSVAALPPSSLRDDRVERFVAFNVEALKRMAVAAPSRSAAAPSAGRKTKAGSDGDGKGGDAKLLREKLDAIRSIEKNLDESGRSE